MLYARGLREGQDDKINSAPLAPGVPRQEDGAIGMKCWRPSDPRVQSDLVVPPAHAFVSETAPFEQENGLYASSPLKRQSRKYDQKFKIIYDGSTPDGTIGWVEKDSDTGQVGAQPARHRH